MARGRGASDPGFNLEKFKIAANPTPPNTQQELALQRQLLAQLIQDNAAALHYIKVIHRVLWWLGLDTEEWRLAENDIAAIEEKGEQAVLAGPDQAARVVRQRDLMIVTLGTSTALEALVELLIAKGLFTSEEFKAATEERTAAVVAAINAAQPKDNVVPLHPEVQGDGEILSPN